MGKSEIHFQYWHWLFFLSSRSVALPSVPNKGQQHWFYPSWTLSYILTRSLSECLHPSVCLGCEAQLSHSICPGVSGTLCNSLWFLVPRAVGLLHCLSRLYFIFLFCLSLHVFRAEDYPSRNEHLRSSWPEFTKGVSSFNYLQLIDVVMLN